MQDSVFTKIIKRELPAEIITENDRTIVILTREPHNPGHMLVIPRVQVDRFYDLEEADYIGVMSTVKKMSKLLELTFNPKRVGLAIVGFEVPHVHVHVIPLNEIADIDHGRARSATPEELHETGDKLRTILAQKKSFEAN